MRWVIPRLEERRFKEASQRQWQRGAAPPGGVVTKGGIIDEGGTMRQWERPMQHLAKGGVLMTGQEMILGTIRVLA